MKNEIQKIANKVQLQVGLKRNVDRCQVLTDALKEAGLNAVFVGDKPHTGCAFFAKEMKNVIRVNYRCGYGRNNYAPCVEISKG